MDLDVENNLSPGVKETLQLQPSTNGSDHKNGSNIEIVDLARDSPSSNIESNGDFNLPDLEDTSEDSKLLSKSEFLKSLSAIDNIVIQSHSNVPSSEDMLIQYMDQSISQNVSETPKTNLNFTTGEGTGQTNGCNSDRNVNRDETHDQR